MANRKRLRKTLASAFLAGGLLVGLAVPASADIGGTINVPRKTSELVFDCSPELFVSGTANWYRQRGDISDDTPFATTQATGDPANPSLAVFAVPKGAQAVSFQVVCEPIPPTTQTITFTGPMTPGELVVVSCPGPTPYLVSVQEVLMVWPSTGATMEVSYTVTSTGVEFWTGLDGWNYRVTMTCSSAPQ
jgi:hypothetical protein